MHPKSDSTELAEAVPIVIMDRMSSQFIPDDLYSDLMFQTDF